MNDRQLLGLLGLACRAGQLVPGAEKTLAALREDKAALVLLDAAAARNTRKKLSDGCAHRGVRLLEVPEGLLGQAIGQPGVYAAAAYPGGLSGKIEQTMTTGGDRVSAAKNILEGTGLNG